MATRTRTGNRVTAPVFKSKSDAARAMYADGSTVTQVAEKLAIGYAFAYGIAKRAGYAQSAAARKPTKFVRVENGIALISTSIGTIKVHADGTIEKPRVTKPKA